MTHAEVTSRKRLLGGFLWANSAENGALTSIRTLLACALGR